MRNIINFFVLASCFVYTSFTYGQVDTKPANAERIITESSAPAEDIYIDDIVTKRMMTEAKILPYEPVREADIAWEKRIWRLVDTREKLNLVWRAEQQPLFNIFKELIQNGDITVFEKEDFKEALSFEAVEKKLYKVDTITKFNEETYLEEIKVIRNTRDWHDVNQYRVKEIWYFDEEASMLKNRIIAIAPMYAEIVDGLDKPLEYPLFWVYYPEARQFLSKYRVINDENDASPMTWSDLLDNRYFTSIIYKRTNVLDYSLKHYFSESDPMSGIDILMESDKIKQELFNFEHDLWEY